MTAIALPLEIAGLFMEELFDDKRSLAQKLRLKPQVEEHASYDWYEKFLLQIWTLSRLCANVQQLTFTSEGSDGQPVCSGPVLQHILAALPNLRIFEMSYLDFNGSHKSSELALSLPPVTSLFKLERVALRNVLGLSTYRGRVVESGSSDSFGLAEFLNIFDEIRDLQLDNGALPFMYPVTWHLLEASPTPLGRPQGRLLRAERVHLTGQQSARSLAVLQHMVDLNGLKRLRIQLSPAVLSLVDDFISRSINIEHIHLNLRLDLTFSRVSSLAHCSQLKTLRISTIDFLPGTIRWANDMWDRAMDVLQCAPSSLRQIVLDIVFPTSPFEGESAESDGGDISVVDDLDWTVFNAILARRNGPQILLLSAHLRPWTRPMQDAIRSKVSVRVRDSFKLMFGKPENGRLV